MSISRVIALMLDPFNMRQKWSGEMTHRQNDLATKLFFLFCHRLFCQMAIPSKIVKIIFYLIYICQVVYLYVCMNPVNGQAVGPILTKFGMGA